ncbi:MAG: glycosyltransferase family 39 protein [Thermoflexales bacterium]|nr:glycosyltransferase family 39 protein [Thermoflexales bacterium]
MILLWVLFAQAIGAAVRTSLTIDEGLHITSGYSIWRTGDYRLVEEHPPLAKLIATWPLLLVPDLPSPVGLPGWEEGELVRVMKGWLQPYRPFERLVFASRVSIVLISLVLGAAVFRWAAELAGVRAGLLALALYAFDPNILAHSPLAATDLGATAFIFFALYALWRAWRRPGRATIVMAGVTLGLAQATKISALILLPLFVALAGTRAACSLPPKTPYRGVGTGALWQTLGQMGVLLAAIFTLAGLTLWAVYGFELKTPPGWSMPVPAASHLIPFERVQADLSSGRPTFLMGQLYERGVWYYFPLAFALKTPLPALILLCVSAVLFILRAIHIRRNAPAQMARHLFGGFSLWAFPLVYLAAALVQPFNIGYRHLLPVLPFMFVFIGAQVSSFTFYVSYHPELVEGRFTFHVSRFTIHASRFTFYTLLLWYASGTLLTFPHYLAYFNELAGGPAGGYRYLVDSNVDWGQGWKELKAYMDSHGVERIKFAQFSSNDPATYGIDYEPIAPMTGVPPVLPARFNPASGVYVISASPLQGLLVADVNSYDYFRHRTPTARIGHALFVYDVRPLVPPPGWAASCAAPAPPLEPADMAQGFGRDDLRLVYFDCQQTWVFPGNSPQGWTVLPYSVTQDKGAFAQRWLEQADLVFTQKQSFARPPHAIFLAPGGETRATLTGAVSLSASVGGTVEFLGYALDRTVARPGQSIELVTLWRVTGQPPGPLSVMAHLVGAEGQAVAVGDGLGFTSEQWQPGDVFAQRHTLTLPPDTPAGTAWVQTGLYTLADIQRLEITQTGQAIGDSLRLAAVDINP